MIAMRTLETMYPAAGWIRKIFYKISEKRSSGNLSAAPTRATSPQPQPEAPELNSDRLAELHSLHTSEQLGSQQPPRCKMPPQQQHQQTFGLDPSPLYRTYLGMQDDEPDQQYLAGIPGGSGLIDFENVDQMNLGDLGGGINQWENGEMMSYLQHLVTYDPPWPNDLNTTMW
jgi:hypothetical protein